MIKFFTSFFKSKPKKKLNYTLNSYSSCFLNENHYSNYLNHSNSFLANRLY